MATFKEAFAAARKTKGPGATFTWNGKKYTTDMASDKKSDPKPAARSGAVTKAAGAVAPASGSKRSTDMLAMNVAKAGTAKAAKQTAEAKAKPAPKAAPKAAETKPAALSFGQAFRQGRMNEYLPSLLPKSAGQKRQRGKPSKT